MSHLSELGKKIVVRSPNWLGDAVMTLPAVKLLSDSLPQDSELIILCKPNLVEFWKMVPGIRQVIPVGSSLLKTIHTLRSLHLSAIIVFPNSIRTGLEAFLSGAPKRFGYNENFRQWLFNRYWSKGREKKLQHQANEYLQLMKYIGCDWDGQTMTLPKLSKPENKQGRKPFIAICPGAEYGPAKRWLAERYANVVTALQKEFDIDVLILGGPKDEVAAYEVWKGMNEKAQNLTGKTTMNEFMSYIANANLVLCNDSGAMHLSSAFGTPAVAIFGSTEDAMTGPLHPNVEVVREKVECSPCFLRECPIDFRCMTQIDEARVLRIAVQKLKTMLSSPHES